jgi:hypothetical protein
MTPHFFNTLNQGVQQKLLLRKSVFLSERQTDDFVILLFQLESFYVEIYYLKESDEIVFIKCFECTDDLEPYLEKINISSFISFGKS